MLYFYNIVDLGAFAPPNASFNACEPADINDEGLIVGTVRHSNGVNAFTYRAPGPIVNLGQLLSQNPANTGANTPGPNNLASGVNNTGQIAFMADRSAGGGKYAPARVEPNGILTMLPLLGPAPKGASPGSNYDDLRLASYYTAGINQAGDVVGQAGTQGATPGSAVSLPFLSSGTATISLGNLAPAGSQSRAGASGINARCDVVGYSQGPKTSAPVDPNWNPAPGQHAFFWTQATGMCDLNSLVTGPSPIELLQAYAINAGGDIVGYGRNAAANTARAFHFKGGQVWDLGTSPNGGISVAYDISDRGEIVGEAYLDGTGVGNARACIFLPGHGAVDLGSLISPIEAQGWTLFRATAVNNRGQIVGYGQRQQFQNQTRGFLLNPVILRIPVPQPLN